MWEESERKEFKDIFQEEGKNLTQYGSTHPAEFFAEALRMMHTSLEEQKMVRQNAPRSYDYIVKALDTIARYKLNFQN